MTIPSLTRQMVLSGISRILDEGVPPERRSQRFCVVHEGHHLPPKYVVSMALWQERTGGLPPANFSGGAETNTRLRDLGFAVVNCNCGGSRVQRKESAKASGEAPPHQRIIRGGIKKSPRVSNGAVITATFEGEYAATARQRLGALEATLNRAIEQVSGPFLLVLPAGFFTSGVRQPQALIELLESHVAEMLAGAPAGTTVSFGIDGRRDADQLAIAVNRHGIAATGRKFNPTAEEADFLVRGEPMGSEGGTPRVFEFAGRRFYLSVCYDVFGLAKLQASLPGFDAILSLVHDFSRPGTPGSGAGYFARYGFAGASRRHRCPVFGTVLFKTRILENWPTAVVWNRGAKRLDRWRYADNPVEPQCSWALGVSGLRARCRAFDLDEVYGLVPSVDA